MKLKNVLLSLLAFHMIGCAKSNDPSPTQNAPDNQSNTSPSAAYEAMVKQELADLKTKAPEIYSLMEKSTCISTDSCPEEIVTAGVAANKAEQVMIFSPYSFPRSGLLSNSDRISGIYLKESEGAYKKITAQAPVSAPVHQLALMAAKYPGSFPKEFPTLGEFLLQHTQYTWDDVSNHSQEMLHHTIPAYVFDNLAYHNPDVNFVFVGEGLEFDSKKCPTPMTSKKILELAKKDLKKRFSNLKQLIQKHKIQSILFPVHLSRMISQEFNIQGCSMNIDSDTSVKLTYLYQDFFEKILENNKNLYIVEPTNRNPKTECFHHQRWFQVSGFSRIHSKIPKSGLDNLPEEITQTDSQIPGCVSFAVNSGMKKTQTPQESTLEYFDQNSYVLYFDGLTTMPLYPGSEFNAADSALSMIRYITAGIPAEKKMRFLFMKTFDPFLHQQFVKK